MDSSHITGFVWPRPPVPGDTEEITRFVPEGVEWHLLGTPRESADDAPPAITRERLYALAENPNIEATAKELLPVGVQAIGYGCTSAESVAIQTSAHASLARLDSRLRPHRPQRSKL